MRFKIDENLPIEAAEALRQAGHDAATVLEQKYGGSPDAQLADLCQREGRSLVTLDMDFADIRAVVRAVVPLYKRCLSDGRMRREDLLNAIRSSDLITPNDKKSILAAIARHR